jgi:predicted nucleic acid-binding protein
MGVLVGTTPETEHVTRSFLASFQSLSIDAPVASRSVEIRKTHKIKLPDAIVWATAQVHGRILVTRNTKDFVEDEPGVRVPYRL